MPKTWYDGLQLPKPPRWNTNGGVWYTEQGTSKNQNADVVQSCVPTPSYRYKPSMNSICEPLLGTSLRRDSKIVGVSYPKLSDRLRIYREGIELIKIFNERDDLFALAMYRRQVTYRGGIPADELFFNLACDAELSKAEWHELALRMPDRALIYHACVRRATLPREIMAAE